MKNPTSIPAAFKKNCRNTVPANKKYNYKLLIVCNPKYNCHFCLKMNEKYMQNKIHHENEGFYIYATKAFTTVCCGLLRPVSKTNMS